MTRQEVQRIFNEEYAANSRISALNTKLVQNKATLSDAQNFANQVADIASRTLKRCVDISGDIESLETVANQVIGPLLRSAQGYVAKFTQDVETLNNTRAGLSLKGVASGIDESRISNMLERIIEKPAESTFLLEKPALRNQMGSVVRSTMRSNAQLRNDAGLAVKISRSTDGGCCGWCEEIAGIYDYGREPDDFYSAHRNCTCVWSTYTSKRNITNMRFETDENGDLHRIVNYH